MMTHFARHVVSVALAIGLMTAAFGCCGTTAGPTAPAASYSGTLGPGELRFFDTDTPSSTTQINLDFTLDSTSIPLRLRQIDSSCLPAGDDSCQSYYDSVTPPRPAGYFALATPCSRAVRARGSSCRTCRQTRC